MVLAIALLVGVLLTAGARAETAEERGLAIARAADARYSGYRDYRVRGEMVLRDRGGGESRREFRVSGIEIADASDRSLIVFDWPADVRDTALLTVENKSGDDDQWLYLPALKRVKRISSANRSGSFVASEFSYEDLLPAEVERYTYRWLRDEPCPGIDGWHCFVNERRPVDKDSGYAREVTWIDQAEHRLVKVDYFDRKDSPLKSLTTTGYQLHDGRHWRPAETLMVNHQTGKSTLMRWRDYRFDSGLAEDSFSRRALERAS